MASGRLKRTASGLSLAKGPRILAAVPLAAMLLLPPTNLAMLLPPLIVGMLLAGVTLGSRNPASD